MSRDRIRYIRRGRVVDMPAGPPDRTLLDHLRLDCGATGTKEGCNEGDCGACTVVLARLRGGQIVHEAVNACILLAGQVDGAEVITVEDLGSPEALHPVQQAMVNHHGSQCGFCTPGIVMSLFALYQDGARPVTHQTVCDALAGNLCRCTGYRPIAAAAKDACAGAPDDAFRADEAARMARLAALDDWADVFVGTDACFFAAPASTEALARLAEAHPDAVLIGGATDAGLWVTKKLQRLEKIIWLGRVRALDTVRDLPDALDLGAGVTVRKAQAHLAAIDPDLGELVRRFGSEQVRASATVGGNIANGSPIGDLAPCLIALDARVTLQKGAHTRALPLERFFIAYGRQDRAPGEFVRSLSVPKLEAGQHFRCFKVSKRFDEDISAVMGAFRFTLADGAVRAARIAFNNITTTPKHTPT
ncbi:MAG TPA: xanthine dehydrogenase small subunit, partial [Beijerinckiaceae bacterium]|nr:xanthine dehydrogenase small subunit [Beijerinckiaceae bacterium]